jgi:uncharacterized protein
MQVTEKCEYSQSIVEESPKKEILCFYHSPCNDGMAARAVISTVFEGKVDFEPTAPYQTDLVEKCRNRKVIFVDLVPKEIFEIQKVAEKIFIIDHHSGNEQTIRDLTQHENVRIFFSISRSAAFLTYQWAFAMSTASAEERAFYDFENQLLVPVEQVPRFLHLIDDRDRFINAFEETKPLAEWLFFLQDTLETEELEKRYRRYIFDGESIDEAISSAKTIAQVAKNATNRSLKRVSIQELFIGDQFYVVGVVNANSNQSDIGNAILEDPRLDFSLVWSGNGPCSFSARSRDDRVSVSDIAKLFGGGGHRNASGFSYPYSVIGTRTYAGAKHIKKTKVCDVMGHPMIILNCHSNQTLANHLFARKRYINGQPITVGRFLSGGDINPTLIVMWHVSDTTTKITVYSEYEDVTSSFAKALGVSKEQGKILKLKIEGVIPSWLFP